MVLAKERYGIRERELVGATLVAFTAETRMSGVDLEDGRSVRKGAADAVRRWVEERGGTVPAGGRGGRRHDRRPGRDAARGRIRQDRGAGSLPRRARAPRVLGVVYLKDIVKPGHRRSLRRPAAHGHPHRDDHR